VDQFNGTQVNSTTTSSAALGQNSKGHTLQIISGPARGKCLEIIDTTASNVTVFGNQVANLVEGTEFFIIKDWTLNTLIGGGEKVLPSGWISSATEFDPRGADQLFAVSRTGGFNQFFHVVGTGWRQAGRLFTDVGNEDFLASI